MKNTTLIKLLCVLVCLALSSFAVTGEEPVFELKKVSGNVYCLFGNGCNIGILKTNDGFLVVDAQYGQTAAKVLENIASLSAKPVKYLINTHYHDDHTGGNEVVGKDAVIIMHPNCKKSLVKHLKEQKMEKAYISKIKTWKEGKVIQLGQETVRLLHFKPAHTSGDTVVVFETSKVIHPGDLFFNKWCPYIDVKDGSDTENWIKTIKTLCEKYPDYKIIPGHGKIATAKDYLEFAAYLTFLRKEVAAAVKAGKTREQAMETINTDAYKNLKTYGDFLTAKNNIAWVYDEFKRKTK